MLTRSKILHEGKKALPLWSALVLVFLAQIGYSQTLRPLRPAIEEMPYPPGPSALKLMALGDDQFLFRVLSRWMQDVGDGGGRVRPLREYDYGRVVAWMRAIDGLDRQSDFVYTLGARYFGAISDPQTAPARVGQVAAYFREVALADPAHRWPWLVWAAVKAQHTVKDSVFDHQLGDDLLTMRGVVGVPEWLPLLAAPLYRAAGDSATAAALDADPELQATRLRAMRSLNARLHQMGVAE